MSETKKVQLPVVIGIIKNDEGKIFLQKRVDPLIPEADAKWEFPGGKIEHGESPKDAVVRECLEEMGCEVRIIRLLPEIQSNIWERRDGISQHVLLLCYEMELVSGEAHALDKKVSEIGWFTKEEALKLDTLKRVYELLDLLEI